jgi:hypothetical protein
LRDLFPSHDVPSVSSTLNLSAPGNATHRHENYLRISPNKPKAKSRLISEKLTKAAFKIPYGSSGAPQGIPPEIL